MADLIFPKAASTPLLFHGTLLNQQGNAIKDAKIQLWQTDLDGNYLHPNPQAANSPKFPDHSSIVSDFQYFGTDATDINGNFEFLTYRPGIYPNRPYSHFHFMVWLNDPVVGDDGEDPLPALVTQFYFRDESPPFPDELALDVTEVDPSMYKYGSYVNGTIVVDANPSLTGDALLATSPKQPEGPFYPEPQFFSMDNDLTTADYIATQTTLPTVAPATLTKSPTTPGPTDSDLPTADYTATQTTLPTVAPETSTKSPTTPGPTPPIQSNNNGTLSTSTAPTLQPVQMTSSSAAASECLFRGSVWFLALYAVLWKCIL